MEKVSTYLKRSGLFLALFTMIIIGFYSCDNSQKPQSLLGDNVVKPVQKVSATQVCTVKAWRTDSIRHDSSWFTTNKVQYDSIVTCAVASKLQSVYVVLDDVIADIDGNISYWKGQNVNEVNLYARNYITTASKRVKLSAVIAKLHAAGMKVNIDYRLTTELPSWDAYFAIYTNAVNRPDGMVTEREPYVTGDYAGFYPFLKQGKAFAAKWGITINCYMGHPTPTGWDSIVYYCDRVYLSNYISMSTYNGANGQWRYIAGRIQFITDAAKKQGKLDYKICYIKSLEMKKWGAGSDFMGDAYIGKTFYGSIMTQGFEQYESNATADQKKYTELIGDCIFHHKYAVLAIPK